MPVKGTCFSCPRENLHLLLTKMAQKYRDVFCLMPGNRLLVVLNGVTVIQEGVVRDPSSFDSSSKQHSSWTTNSKNSS
ncbi:hypothetical protein OS493_004839 [Desmophyllum pertusum]|uniref:Uncharacterized protein n=1 Tax=Desmophyllum pertusum TaxID=174260 RepID=A0A9X0CT32_9CNID|nr:hypothetical protein OS493_004839 [Desmophyllum pertusum]